MKKTKMKKILLLGNGALKIFTGSLVSKVLNIKKLFLFGGKNLERSDLVMHFWDLPETTRFLLKDEFRKLLFDSVEIAAKPRLAKKLGVSLPYMNTLRSGKYSITRIQLLLLSELSGIPKEKIESNISIIKTRAGGEANFKFPLVSNSHLASLVGHVFGDGCIYSNKRQFEYSNTNPILLREVALEVKKLFCLEPIKLAKDKIVFPSIAGDLLLYFGAPKAPKIDSNLRVPSWIMNSSGDEKSSFLKALFDDDGSTMLSKNYAAKGINLYQTRHIGKKKDLSDFLSDVSILLQEFGVSSGNPLVSRVYDKEDGKHVVMYINITDFESMSNFCRYIDFSESSKKDKLYLILDRGTRYSKKHIQRTNKQIIQLLRKTSSMSTSQLAQELEISGLRVLKRLHKLRLKGLVKTDSKTKPNRDYIWKLSEVRG